ncbi:MAG: superoxide dismutase [Candidatus Harrisonbacteria bacterium CG10_big_fil_rev_8_21_14_0_10_42_17]|uniref:Superoxide dismutase n=1 Tax=Candidatus Harrisonbacteria bacterium CG10_big_fil_rev_8_21_14_0_10_42_17 TaxID=1974584 RepID=A0A2M6WHK6_9BACT|nr:MAG: superoxide dismutase [Candidatus Harrisonbacteria bacterium CG10_big_fil_rev_8_21_14_0_10_42_17]
MKHELPELPYDYQSLEPYIDAETMEIHYSKHHAGYVKNLNAVLEGYDTLIGKSPSELLTSLDSIPEPIRTAVRNNGGGHYNHSLFWKSMSSDGGKIPTGSLLEALNEAFGSFDGFQAQFSEVATKHFGSGWAWLSKNNAGQLTLSSTPNQDSPLMKGLIPLLGLDVWEHAYYLKYHNKRADYITAWWNVVNWAEVSHRFTS